MLGLNNILLQSPLVQKWLVEHACKTTQAAIISFLEGRFDEVPEELAAEIRSVTDLEQLERCTTHAGRCTSLKDFRKRITGG